MLIKFNSSDKQDKIIEDLKEHFEVGTASKAVQLAFASYLDVWYDAKNKTARVGILESQKEEIKNLIREKNRIDSTLRNYAEQNEINL
jgi:hypothetical protein